MVNATISRRYDIKMKNIGYIRIILLEKSIIADWTVIMWLDKEINDTRQITAMLQNRNEAHRYSEANNLKSKADHRIQMVEDVKHKQAMYSLKHTDWKGWANGNYQL